MNRREFASGIAWAVTGGMLASGCSGRIPDDKQRSREKEMVTLLPFSASRLHAKLEKLRDAFLRKGHDVSESLGPPVPEDELRNRCRWFPTELPAELVALYGWHEGSKKSTWDTEKPLWLRDCGFCGIDIAESEYRRIMDSYGIYPDVHELLKNSFPFAEFNGGWLVLPCAGQALDDRFERPVISVMEGIDIWFYSVELMVDTCTEWIENSAFQDGVPSLSPDREMEIWRKHNPGFFEA
jgi:hypothetical protein